MKTNNDYEYIRIKGGYAEFKSGEMWIPVPEKAIKDLVKGFVADTEKLPSPNDLMPQNILHIAYDKSSIDIIYYMEAREQVVYFNNQSLPEKVTLDLPSYIIKYTNGKLKAFCYKTKGRPTEETTLYRFPFPNFYQNGGMCFGNIQKHIPFKSQTYQQIIQSIEAYLWKSYFTHDGDGQITKNNYAQAIKSNDLKNNLIKTNAKWQHI